MRRELVLRSRIAQPDNEFHAASLTASLPNCTRPDGKP
jgi:hypothetical protein